MKKLILGYIFAGSLCANACDLNSFLRELKLDFNEILGADSKDGFPTSVEKDKVSMTGVEESIKLLLPKIQSYAIYVEGLGKLSNDNDPDAVRYFKQIVRDLDNKKIFEAIRRQSTSTVSFLRFIESSLNNFLISYERSPKNEAFDVLASEYLWVLWQEINESADKTAADLTTLMALEWSRSDSNWKITKAPVGNIIKYHGIVTDDINEKSTLLQLLDQDHREYTKFAKKMGQENFDKFFNSLGVSLYYDELMLYQNILEVLSSYIDMELKSSDCLDKLAKAGSNEKARLARITMQTIYEPQDYLGLLSHSCSKLNNKKPLIDSIFKLANPNSIESVCQFKLKAMLKDLQQALPDDSAQRKKDKKKAKRLRQKAARSLKAETSLEEEVPLESDDELVPCKTLVAPSTPPAIKMKPVKPEQKESAYKTGFNRSTFSDVVMSHDRGTVNTHDFKDFLRSIGGGMSERRRNGMTKYYLPNAQNPEQNMYFHVHLPHADSDPFYPAIFHHFIRPSVKAAGYTAEMFE